MPTLAGPLHAIALLLLAAGAAKLARPAGTVVALAMAGVPARRWTARVLGAGEVIVALAALAVGGVVPAALLCLLHVGFAIFALRLVARAGPAASCGCFGSTGAPVTRAHVVTTAGAALLAGAAAVAAVGGVGDAVRSTPLGGVPYLALVAGLAAVAHLCLTALPELQSAAGNVRALSSAEGA